MNEMGTVSGNDISFITDFYCIYCLFLTRWINLFSLVFFFALVRSDVRFGWHLDIRQRINEKNEMFLYVLV